MRSDHTIIMTVMAIVGLSISCVLGLAHCGATDQEKQLALYGSVQTACVAQATSYDAGVACLQMVQKAFCGPGGVWSDAGICPDGDIR